MNQPPSGYYGNDYPGMNKREGAGEAKTEGEAKGEGETKVETGADANETVTPSSGGEPKAEPKAEGEGDSPKTAAVTLDPEEVAQIEKIADPAERELALAQKLCPVGSEEDPTGGHLGAMGKPIKVEHDGKVVFLCCKGCEKQFQADPAKYVARAEAARKAK